MPHLLSAVAGNLKLTNNGQNDIPRIDSSPFQVVLQGLGRAVEHALFFPLVVSYLAEGWTLTNLSLSTLETEPLMTAAAS